MNKFLKLLLIALVAAVLPGCGSEKSSSSTEKKLTAEEQAAADAAAKEAAANEVNPDFVNFFKLLEAKKLLAVEITGGSALPGTAAVPGHSSFPVGSKISFAAGSDLTKLSVFKITEPTVLNAIQAIGTTEVAIDTSFGDAQLAFFSLTVVKSGDVPSITVLTPPAYGKGLTGNPATANTAQNPTTQAERKFKLLLDSKLSGTDAALSGVATLQFTIENKTYSVPVKVSIA